MKRLSDLKQGAYFFYGGIQWVILENDSKIGATLALAAEPAFNRAFDEENRNDWRVSSLRRELNGPFFDALIAEGANRAAFLDWESDLTADNGMTDYGTATDKIALLSDGLYRKYRQFNQGDSLGMDRRRVQNLRRRKVHVERRSRYWGRQYDSGLQGRFNRFWEDRSGGSCLAFRSYRRLHRRRKGH